MAPIWIIFGLFMLLSWLISSRLKSKFKAYSQIPINYGLSGRQVAEKMLADNQIYDVRVESVQGHLTDHYHPVKKTINLSPEVYSGSSVAAAAVAAHECGHALQHAKAYSFVQMRSALVPIVSFTSRWIQWVLLAGVLMIQSFPQLLLVGIILFAISTFFSIITLPVEIDASRRALVWLKSIGITDASSQDKAADALKWASYTYFIAAISALVTLLYYITIFTGRRN